MSSIENIKPSDRVQVFFDTYFDKNRSKCKQS